MSGGNVPGTYSLPKLKVHQGNGLYILVVTTQHPTHSTYKGNKHVYFVTALPLAFSLFK